MKNKKATTLLEIIIVVVILSFLLTMAFPAYKRTIERSRLSEAVSVLGDLRRAMLRYYDNTGVLLDENDADWWEELDINLPNFDSSADGAPDSRYWTFEVGDDPGTEGSICYAEYKDTTNYYYVGMMFNGDLQHDEAGPFADED